LEKIALFNIGPSCCLTDSEMLKDEQREEILSPC